MITKNQIKLIRSLREKKNRVETGLFIVEGEKSVLELLNSDFIIDFLLVTKEFFTKNKTALEKKVINVEIIEQTELEKLGSFETNDSALAVVKQKENIEPEFEDNGLTLVLDEIKDPGNLGTIIRISDWYGIRNIIASQETVDFYNPKVIAASKGSFLRINMFYTDLKSYLAKQKTQIFGTFLDGKNIYEMKLPKNGIIVMGNESNGISKEMKKFVTEKITIPAYGKAESLNVAIATAIVLDNFKRNL